MLRVVFRFVFLERVLKVIKLVCFIFGLGIRVGSRWYGEEFFKYI